MTCFPHSHIGVVPLYVYITTEDKLMLYFLRAGAVLTMVNQGGWVAHPDGLPADLFFSLSDSRTPWDSPPHLHLSYSMQGILMSVSYKSMDGQSHSLFNGGGLSVEAINRCRAYQYFPGYDAEFSNIWNNLLYCVQSV